MLRSGRYVHAPWPVSTRKRRKVTIDVDPAESAPMHVRPLTAITAPAAGVGPTFRHDSRTTGRTI